MSTAAPRPPDDLTTSWQVQTEQKATTATWYRARPRAEERSVFSRELAIVLAPGAGAGHDHPSFVSLASACAGRGIHVVTFNFPYAEAGRKRPDPPPVLQRTWRDVVASVHARPDFPSSALFAGGRSMGGRIATEVVAAEGAAAMGIVGIVCFGYPLRPPQYSAPRSVAHFARLGVPILIVQGTRDAFGEPDDIRGATDGLTGVDVLAVEGADHALRVPRSAGRSPAAFLDEITARVAAWMATVR
jgi:predicted alpha/beta-hydrolase family hydrolase